MIQEEKSLLIKEFSARLPYGVMFDYNNNEPLKVEGIVRNIVYFKGYNYQTEGDECYANITECKIYLRPLSNMTKEEEEELRLLKNQLVDCDETNDEKFNGIISEIHNLYFSHHLDFMGLIPKGLAFEAPDGMYNINNLIL